MSYLIYNQWVIFMHFLKTLQLQDANFQAKFITLSQKVFSLVDRI
jgi:hypothetical protein